MGNDLKCALTGETHNFDLKWFVNKKRDRLEEQLYIEKISDEYTEENIRFDVVLKQLNDDKLRETIYDAAFARERTGSFIYYSQGLREGLRLALKIL